ncbi:MAG TPA: N-acetylglucosamine-6-phosphate deacetylase [Candidatus Limnocylindria bacterium]|nr:N-acetylglucosamine-6-phosphate deacetylase [Candidatus Limnocylindria bacterium]
MISLVGRLLTPEDLGVRAVSVEDGRVTAIGQADDGAADALGGPDAWIIPGLVDIQLNGAFGVDFTDATGAIEAAALALPSTGVTAFVPTIVSSAPAIYGPALTNLARPMPSGAARVLGAHLEGPYIAQSRAGAHDPSAIRPPDLDELRRWLDGGSVRIVTLAPELPGAEAMIRELVRRGVVVAIGHSDATWDQADAAITAGARLGTHLFNAMRPFHHRDPGIVGRLLEPGVAVSVVADGVHVAPQTISLVATVKAPDDLILVTDGLAALGEPPGSYRLGSQAVTSDGTVARLAGGTISGSVLPMATALGRLVAAGLDPEALVRATSTNPARLLGLGHELGSIAVGRVADLVVLDAEWNPLLTLVQGRQAAA